MARGDMAHRHLDADALLVEIEHGQPFEEQLAEHHALAKARRGTKCDPLGQLVEDLLDMPLVMRVRVREAVAYHHPVDFMIVDQGDPLAPPPDPSHAPAP